MPVLNNQQVYRITDLPEAGTVQPDDLVEIVQDGHNKKAEVSAVSAAVENTSPDISGRLPNLALTPTGVPAGVYGSKHKVPRITVDSKGRITNATQESVEINSDDMSGTAPTVLLNNVFPSTHDPDREYGDPTKTPVIKVDRKGRVRYINEVNIQFPLPEQISVNVNSKNFDVLSTHFGKTVLLIQTGLPPDVRDDTINCNIMHSSLTSVAVGEAVVIRLHPLMVSAVLIRVTGSKPIKVRLHAGELINIQKVGSSEFVVREIYTVKGYDESYFGYRGRVGEQIEDFSATDYMSYDKVVPIALPDTDTTLKVGKARFLCGGPILPPFFGASNSILAYGFGHFGSALRINSDTEPGAFSGIKHIFESEYPGHAYVTRIPNSVGSSVSLRLMDIRSKFYYTSSSTTYHRRFHDMVWYSTFNSGAYGFQAYSDSSSFRICRPRFEYSPLDGNHIKLREWRTNTGWNVPDEDSMHVVQLTATTFALIRYVQVIKNDTSHVLRVSGRYFDTRMPSYEVGSVSAAAEASIVNDFTSIFNSSLFTFDIPFTYGTSNYGSIHHVPQPHFDNTEYDVALRAAVALPGVLCLFVSLWTKNGSNPADQHPYMVGFAIRYYQKPENPAPGAYGWPPVVFDTSLTLSQTVYIHAFRDVSLFDINTTTHTCNAVFIGSHTPTNPASFYSYGINFSKRNLLLYGYESPIKGCELFSNTGYVGGSLFVHWKSGSTNYIRTYTRSGVSLFSSVMDPGPVAQYGHRFGDWRTAPIPAAV